MTERDRNQILDPDADLDSDSPNPFVYFVYFVVSLI